MAEFAERIAHVDMDAFFVEVERLHRPELRGRPVVVGGAGDRGVVASASYEARRHGIRSAMPMARARRALPGLVVVPPGHGRYREVSRQVFEILDALTPRVEPVSVDEAFVDIGGLRLLHAGPLQVGEEIRRRIREQVGLPCSIGIATSRLLAKLASRDAKPDGLLLVESGSEQSYLHPKGVHALWGVGDVTQARLESLGIETVGDLAAFPRSTLEARLGSVHGGMLWDLAHGLEPAAASPEVREEETRAMSVEQTYPSDLSDRDRIETELLRHADRLAGRLRRAGVEARTVGLKVRYGDFTTVTRRHTLPEATATVVDLFEAGKAMLSRTAAGVRPLRLLGLSAAGLVDAAEPRQMTLDGRPWEEIDEAVEAVRGRFGRDAVGRARLGSGPGDGDRDQPPQPEEGMSHR